MTHDSDATPPGEAGASKRVAIYLVAQNAVHSLAGVLDRIPAAIRDRADEILVADAGSRDDTYLVGVGYKAVSGFDKLTVIRAPQPGVGAAMKSAIDHCRERGYDVVVLLHADGKYAPEVMESLVAPLDRGGVDAVLGSRFLGNRWLPAGMPRHKALAIRALGWLQERTLRLGLSEYHCGYMALSIPAIADLPYRENGDDLVFNADLIAQLRLGSCASPRCRCPRTPATRPAGSTGFATSSASCARSHSTGSTAAVCASTRSTRSKSATSTGSRRRRRTRRSSASSRGTGSPCSTWAAAPGTSPRPSPRWCTRAPCPSGSTRAAT